MLIFAAVYIVVFTLYAVYWQKRESECVREKLVEDFYRLAEQRPNDENVKYGGVVYVLKNMNGPSGRAARAQFRQERMSELIVAGIILLAAPIGVIVSTMQHGAS